jgi:hypothetical protein
MITYTRPRCGGDDPLYAQADVFFAEYVNEDPDRRRLDDPARTSGRQCGRMQWRPLKRSQRKRKYEGSASCLKIFLAGDSDDALTASLAVYDSGRGIWPTMSVAERIGCMQVLITEMMGAPVRYRPPDHGGNRQELFRFGVRGSSNVSYPPRIRRHWTRHLAVARRSPSFLLAVRRTNATSYLVDIN